MTGTPTSPTDRFVDTVSHEFRTPLTVIKEYASLVRDGLASSPEEQRRFLEIDIDRADDLNNMVDDMLDVSRLEAGLLGAWRKNCQLSPIVEELRPTLGRKASMKGITLDDIDLVVRNCYVLPVEEMEMRLVHEDIPEILDAEGREEAGKHPYYLADSNKVVTISHHLAHAYSAFAVSPFDQGAVMVTDGVGSYCSDVTEPYPSSDKAHPLARESESYYKFTGSTLETVKKVWMGPSRGFLADEFFNMQGLGALYSRVSSYIFGDWNKCGEVMGLAPYGRPNAIEPMLKLENGHLEVPEWDLRFNKPFLAESGEGWEESPAMSHWEDVAWRVQDDTERVLIARAIWLRETTGARHLTIAGGVGLNCVANGRILREADDLVAFLVTLTDPRAGAAPPASQHPGSPCLP